MGEEDTYHREPGYEANTRLTVQATWFRAHRLPSLCEGECQLGGHGALPDPSLS